MQTINRVLIGLIIVVLSFTVTIVIIFSRLFPATSDTAKQRSATSQQQVPAKKEKYDTVNFTDIGRRYAAYSSNVRIAVVEVKDNIQWLGSEYSRHHAQGKFITIRLFIENNQNDAIIVDSNSFKLIDSRGRVFSHSTEGMTGLAMEGERHAFLSDLNPGVQISVTIPFDVPENIPAQEFELQARGGFMGEPVMLPLYYPVQ